MTYYKDVEGDLWTFTDDFTKRTAYWEGGSYTHECDLDEVEHYFTYVERKFGIEEITKEEFFLERI